jgi:DNA sulfur modification protein DndB
LNIKQEVQYFLDINSYQRGVTKTLRIELLKFISEPESKDDIRNRLFKELNEDINSPLYNRMSATNNIPGKLSHVPFQLAIDPLLESNILKQFDYEGKKALIINYLLAVEHTLKKIEGDSNRITNSIFFQAIFKIFDDVCSMSLTYFKNYKESSFIEILDVMTRLDLTRHTGSNNQDKNALIKEMRNLLEIKSGILGVPEDLLF